MTITTTGERMKSRRKELGISADDVAKALNVSRATVFRYENGDIEKVPGNVLEPLANVLHTTVAYLMGWSEDKSKLRRTDQKSDYASSLDGICIDSCTYGALAFLARKNKRSLQEEIDERLYWSIENDLED